MAKPVSYTHLRKGLEIINNETGRLYNMVEALLDFSRLQNGRIRMDCRPPVSYTHLGIAAKLYTDGPKTVRVEAVGPCEVTADNIKQGDDIEICLLYTSRCV